MKRHGRTNGAFQSTLPARGATRNGWNGKNQYVISIHAPRTGSDAEALFSLSDFSGFQSTLPARGATFSPEMPERIFSFQSTLPARGATERKIYCESPACISIHAPRTGSDAIAGAQLDVLQISIHAPRTGSDELVEKLVAEYKISIHAPRTGSDRRKAGNSAQQSISIHAPRTGSDWKGARRRG